MQTVESILKSVYDDDTAQAAGKLSVGRKAISNWRSWGYFPARLAVPIWEHARERGVTIDVSDIPTMQKVRA